MRRPPAPPATLLAVLAAAAVGLATAALVIAREPAPGELSERWQRGANLTAFQAGAYGEPEARQAMLTARAAGFRRLALVPTWYMDSPDASAVTRDPVKTPTDESLRTAARGAAELGLEIVLKPHVDVADGSFRGEVLPGDRGAWFDSYSEMLLGYADLAEELGAVALVVGTELTSMTLEPEPWRELIAAVRERYDGDLTFAANWVDGAEQIGFWDELDLIGIDAYMPLRTPSPDPGVAELVTAWGPYVERIEALHERWELPVLFTEAGYRSRAGAAVQEAGGPPSERAQAEAYEAAFEALAPRGWFEGIWWWEWSAERIADPGGFSPEGKLAEDVLAEWQGPPAGLSSSGP